MKKKLIQNIECNYRQPHEISCMQRKLKLAEKSLCEPLKVSGIFKLSRNHTMHGTNEGGGKTCTIDVNTHLSWTMVAPPSIAALTASVMERSHFLFIRESVTAYKKRSLGSKVRGLHELWTLCLSLNKWSKGP